MLGAIKEAVSFIKERIHESPDTAIILGTGLGKIVDHLEVEEVVVVGDPAMASAVDMGLEVALDMVPVEEATEVVAVDKVVALDMDP